MGTVVIRKSTTAGTKPSALIVGELAVNVADSPPTLYVGAQGGVAQISQTLPANLVDASDDATAASNGVAVGQPYRNGSVLMVRVS